MIKFPTPSIALRLAIGLTVGTTLLWLGAVAIAALVMRAEMNEAFDNTLEKSAKLLLPLAVYSLEVPTSPDGSNQRGLPTYSFSTPYIVLDPQKKLVIWADRPRADLPPLEIVDGFSNRGNRRRFAYTDDWSGYSIMVFENIANRTNLLRESLVALIWPLLAFVPLIAVGMWFGVRLALRPLERLRRDIAARGGQNLSPLTSENRPKELAPIAEALADLLTRLQAALNAERSFAASSAHQLRTPIAGALAQTQRLAIELGSGKGHKRLKEIEYSLKHLSTMSEKLLQLSRLEAGFARTDHLVDIMPVVHLVVDEFKTDAKLARRIHLTINEGVTIAGPIHEDAFFVALQNLITNGLIHGRKNGWVEIILERDNEIRVRNRGVVLSAESLNSIGDPFVRANDTADGTGLGLSIVQAIIAQAGGEIAFHSPAINQPDGFEVVLKLP